MWFTETPWPPILLVCVAAAVLFVAWNATRRGALLVAAVALLPICVAIYFVEAAIVTEAEQVEAAHYGIRDAILAGDVNGTLDFIAPQATDMRHQVAAGMKVVTIQALRVTDIQIKMKANDTLAVSYFRGNGTCAPFGSFATYWRLSWQRQADRWLITDYARLNPVTGEPIGVWSPQ